MFDLLFALFGMAIGLICYFAPDVAWRILVFSDRLFKRESERTPEWDAGVRRGGVFLMMISTGLLLIVLTSGVG